MDSRIRQHFDSSAAAFDRFYRGKGTIGQLTDRLLRRSMQARFETTFRWLNDLSHKTVLDAGCGSGRYAVECARRGAEMVIGIDFSQTMVDIASRFAREAGVLDTCQFQKIDFIDFHYRSKFDFILALGFFDYTRDAAPYLSKMAALASGSIIASFPVRHHPLNWQRRFRYLFENHPVYFYTKPEIERLCLQAGFKKFECSRLFRDYLLVARI